MEDHFKNIWYLEDENERIKLIEEKEQLILSERKNLKMNFNSDILYKEAKSSFIIGNFISAALTFYLAIEQFLLWANQQKKGNVVEILQWPKSYITFKEALENNFINRELKDELELFTQGCRDQIMHPKHISHLLRVGLRKDPKKLTSFGIEGDPKVYHGPLGCAKRALDLFYKILEFNS